jgi:hypothetical protein
MSRTMLRRIEAAHILLDDDLFATVSMNLERPIAKTLYCNLSFAWRYLLPRAACSVQS